MTREYARLRLEMWATGDIRKLSPRAQHLYFVLLTHPDLSYAGVTDWRPGRLTQMAEGWTVELVRLAADELVKKLFIVVDETTEEALIRSFIRNDGLMKESRVAVSMVKAFAAVASSTLRGVIVHELRRLYADDPKLKGWRRVDGQPGQAMTLLGLDPLDPASLVDGLPVGLGVGLGSGLAQTPPDVSGSVSVPTSPAPTPAPTPPSNEGVSAPKRGSRCPADYAPPSTLVEWALGLGFTEAAIKDMTQDFIDYWTARPGKDGVKLTWDGTWRNWVKKQDPVRRNRVLQPVSKSPIPSWMDVG